MWQQANRNQVPRLVYLNKMDKPGASFINCLHHIEKKLKTIPLPLHFPVGEGREFRGIVDLVSLTVKQWEHGKNSFGSVYSTRFVPSISLLYVLYIKS